MTDPLGRGLYSDPGNWVPGVVPANNPNETFAVIIPPSTPPVSVVFDLAATTLLDGLDLRGGSFFAAPATTLAIAGEVKLDGTLVSEGGTIIAGGAGAGDAFASESAILNAEMGGLIRIAADTYSADALGVSGELCVIQATGSNSEIDLSSVDTFIAQNTDDGDPFGVRQIVSADDGGRIDLSSVTTLLGATATDSLRLIASNGVIDLSSLTDFVRDAPGQHTVTINQGGVMDLGQMTDLSNLTIDLGGADSSFITGSVENLDGSSLRVTSGAAFGQDVIATSYTPPTSPGPFDALSVFAGTINLPTIETIDAPVTIEADSSGVIDLSGLLTAQSLTALAEFDSQIDLSSLAHLTSGSSLSVGVGSGIDAASLQSIGSGTGLEVRNGGSLNAPLLDDLSEVSLTLARPESTLTLADEIVDIDGSQITIRNSASFGSAVTQTGYSSDSVVGSADILFADSGTISLPQIESIEGPVTSDPSGPRIHTIRTGGSTSFIDLSGVQSIESGALGADQSQSLVFWARGGAIDLSSLGSLTGDVSFNSSESASIELGSLDTLPPFTGGPLCSFSLSSGGQILAPQLGDLRGVSVVLFGSGSRLLLGDGVDLTGSRIAVIDNGSFEPLLTATEIGTLASPQGWETSLRADGPGSVIRLPSVEAFRRDPAFGGQGGGSIVAQDGASIDLSSVEQIEGATGTARVLRFEADGGTINLTSLEPIDTGSVVFRIESGGLLRAGDIEGDISLLLDGGTVQASGDIFLTNPSRAASLAGSVTIGADFAYAGGFAPDVTSEADIVFNGATVQRLEVASEDRGLSAPTLGDENAKINTLQVGTGSAPTTLLLEDLIDHTNAAVGESEALYIVTDLPATEEAHRSDQQSVFVDFDSTLRLNGIATYAVLDGEFAGREFKNQLVLLNDLVPDGETRIPFDRGFLSIAGRCLGDANLDNAVDLEDLLTVLGAFGDTTDAGPPAGDLDGSGITALPDLLEVLSNFATDCP